MAEETREFQRRQGEAEFRGHNNGNVVGTQSEIRDIIHHVHHIEEKITHIDDKKQNKVHYGWIAAVIMFFLTQLATGLWWGATITSQQKELLENSKQSVSTKDLNNAQKIRDIEVKVLNTDVSVLKDKVVSLTEQITGMETSIQQLYTKHRRTK